MKSSILLLLIGVSVLVGCEPSPTELANVEAIRSRTRATEAASEVRLNAQSTAYAGQQYATATAAADSAKATAVANEWQAKATESAWVLSIQATQVALPYLNGREHAAATAEAVQRWTLTAALGAGLVVALLMAMAFVLMVRTRARMIPRDASGQLPGILIGGTLTDPQRQIGPSVTMPESPGLLWNLARTVRYLQTGQVLPLPLPQVALTDGGATADHLLEAARQASQVATAAAVFRPGDPKAREEKIELVLKQNNGRLLGAGRMPTVKLIDDPDKVSEFRKVLELESGDL